MGYISHLHLIENNWLFTKPLHLHQPRTADSDTVWSELLDLSRSQSWMHQQLRFCAQRYQCHTGLNIDSTLQTHWSSLCLVVCVNCRDARCLTLARLTFSFYVNGAVTHNTLLTHDIVNVEYCFHWCTTEWYNWKLHIWHDMYKSLTDIATVNIWTGVL